MKKVKILVYGFTYEQGGVESLYMNYFRLINHEKYQVDFIKVYDKIAYEDELINNGSRIYKVSKFIKKPMKFYKEIYEILKNGKYDAFHVNMLTAANILHLKAARKANIPIVIVHSHNGNNKYSLKKLILHYFNRNKIAKLADRLVACSEDSAKWLYGRSNGVIHIKNAIDLNNFCFDLNARREIREEMGLINKFVIGYVARFDSVKNHSFLIDIINDMKYKKQNVCLILIGGGELETSIKDKVKELQLESEVKFCGRMTSVGKIYSAMDCFVFPSKSEGLGMVGIEAQANGLPCVFSDKIPKEAIIAKNVKVLGIEKSDIEKWSNELIKMSKNPIRTNNLKSLEKYDIKKEFNKFIKLYE